MLCSSPIIGERQCYQVLVTKLHGVHTSADEQKSAISTSIFAIPNSWKMSVQRDTQDLQPLLLWNIDRKIVRFQSWRVPPHKRHWCRVPVTPSGDQHAHLRDQGTEHACSKWHLFWDFYGRFQSGKKSIRDNHPFFWGKQQIQNYAV